MISSDDELLTLLMDTFKVELEEHVTMMTQAVLTLEKGDEADNQAELLEQIFRNAHSLKGAARAVELEDIKELAHKLENLFSAAMDGTISLAGDIFDLIYESIDTFKLLMENATNGSENEINLENLLERLESALAGDESSEEPQPLEIPVELVEQSSLQTDTSQETSDIETEAEKRPTSQKMNPDDPEVEASPTIPGRFISADSSLPLPTSDGDTIRVNTSKLDALMNQSGELLVAKIIGVERFANVKAILNTINHWSKEWQNVALNSKQLTKIDLEKDIQPILSFVENGQSRLKMLSARMKSLLKEMDEGNNHIARVTEEIQDVVKQVRMLPVATVFNTFERMVRDIAKKSGKRVNLRISGAETEIDKKILEEIKDPITHLLRNSIDHGIEPPEERLKNGKPECGVIELSAAQQGSNIVIEIADDGRGIDFDKVKKTAVSKGLISNVDAGEISEGDAIALLFKSGFSTAPMVTDISGRGVGLDVVKTNVENLHGKIEVNSTQGAGCCFKITLPLTLTTSKNLLVKAAGQTFAMPTSVIERIIWVRREDVKTVGLEESISLDGTPIVISRLSTVLNLENMTIQDEAEVQLPPGTPFREPAVAVGQRSCPSFSSRQSPQADSRRASSGAGIGELHQGGEAAFHNPPAGEWKHPAVVLAVGERRAALLVDDLVEELDMVTKSLGKQLPRVKNVSGASILGNGNVVVILNPSDLIKSALQSAVHGSLIAPEIEVRQPKTILVVDDSITTRVLEQNILESVGYNVLVAEHGQEALNILAENSIDLVVSDVQMPNIDGFELTATLRESEKYGDMPVILVTSLDSKEDETQGLEVGADAYITKSNFDQSILLDTIQQLI